jgi:chemotaxis methyl-accepting protein methylase
MIRWEMQVRKQSKKMIIFNKHNLKWKANTLDKGGAELGHSLEIIFKNQLQGQAWLLLVVL